ncbi:MAG: hypothetical protein ACTS3F_01980 [Phycisphaerales bacterium]
MPRSTRTPAAASLAGALATAIAIAATPTTAHAGGAESFTGLNADLQQFSLIPGPKPNAAYGAASGQSGFWNIISNVQGIPIGLNDLDGVASGITATITSPNNNGNDCVGGFVTLNWSSLMCDYVWDVAGVVNPVVIEVDNLPPGAYTVFVYGCFPGQTFSPGRVISVQSGNGPFVNKFISGAVLSEQFNEGITHTTHSITVDTGDTVVIQSYDTSGEFGDPVVINGFQIIPVPDPIAEITAPDNLTCGCDPTAISGIASANGGIFDRWTLEWSSTGADLWQTIATSTTPVESPGGFLANWNTAGLTEGFYFLRLTVEAVGKAPQTAVSVVYLDKNFGGLTETGLAGNPVVGGLVCIGGTVQEQCFDSYTVEYRELPAGSFQPVDPSQPIYFIPAVNQTYATWDTIALGIPDGEYEILITAQTVCGNTATITRTITVDNTPPLVEIESPAPCAPIGCDPVEIIGTVKDDNLNSWALLYSDPNGNWITLATGNTEQSGDVLGVFDPALVSGCPTTFRLIASDKAVVNCNGVISNNAEHIVTASTGLPGDIDNDGDIDSDDLGALLSQFGATCP